MSTGMDALDDYTNRVHASLMQLPFIETVGVYPEIPDGFNTPAVFFEVESWELSTDSISGSGMSVELTCNLYLLREFAADEYGQKAKNAAIYVTGWIHDRMFGPATRPAVFTEAQEGDWQRPGNSTASHSVYCVSFTQVVGVGTDPFEYPSQGVLKRAFVGVAPEIGAEHKDDYYGPITGSGE